MKKNDGYTVVQLLLVIAIFSVFTVLALNIGRSAVQRSDFTGVINNFIADYTYAKQYAIRENCYVWFDFSSNGKSYTIKSQASVGDFDNWKVIQRKSNVMPLSGQQFFNGSEVEGFTINSMGEVYAYPMGSSPQPTSVTLTFFVKNKTTDVVDYQKTVNIFPYGGVKVEK